MLSWLNIMSYKNGETPNFNDNSSNINNDIITLSKYAKNLGSMPLMFINQAII